MNGFSHQKWFIFYFSPIGIRPVLGRFNVGPVCLRSNFAPGDGQEATPKGLHSEATPTPKTRPPVGNRPLRVTV